MFLVDTSAGRIVDDEEIKEALATSRPYGEWLHAGLLRLDDLPPRDFLTPQHASVVKHQRVFGYTSEELKILVGPMARTGAEPIGSMGTDTPVAVLSDRPRLLFRSEEHTSELPSLMRTSYAVFCLKKKKNTPQQ